MCLSARLLIAEQFGDGAHDNPEFFLVSGRLLTSYFMPAPSIDLLYFLCLCSEPVEIFVDPALFRGVFHWTRVLTAYLPRASCVLFSTPLQVQLCCSSIVVLSIKPRVCCSDDNSSAHLHHYWLGLYFNLVFP